MQFSPFAKTAIENFQEAKANWIANYNQLLNISVHNITGTDSLVFFDTYDLFLTVLANPVAYGLQDTTDYWNKVDCTNLTYCPENDGGLDGATKYLWFDGTHVTSGKYIIIRSIVCNDHVIYILFLAMHKIIANSIITIRPFGIQGDIVQNQYLVNRTALPISQALIRGSSIDYWMLLMSCIAALVAIQTNLFI
jgi:hypothetical protein